MSHFKLGRRSGYLLLTGIALTISLFAMACATPGYVAPQPDDGSGGVGGANRTDCNVIYNTPYHSTEERQWFEANCSKWPAAQFANIVPTRGPEPAQCAQIRGKPYESDQQRRFYLDNCNQSQASPTPGDPGQGSDRTDCNTIRGTFYRSSTERTWYLANCQAPAPVQTPGLQLVPGAATRAAQVVPGVATQAPPVVPGVATPLPPPLGPDRFDCNAIRNTPFRSANERAWYQLNCR